MKLNYLNISPEYKITAHRRHVKYQVTSYLWEYIWVKTVCNILLSTNDPGNIRDAIERDI